MPNDVPDSQIRDFLATNIKPVIPTGSADMECPICQVPYASTPPTSVHPDLPSGEEEYAVQVQNKAECEHIFGRRCLEDHLRSGNPWSHKCPSCRTEWLPAPNDASEDAREETDWDRLLNLLADTERAQGSRRVGWSLERSRAAREDLDRLFALLDTQDAEDAEEARQELRRVGSSLERLRDAMDEELRSI